VWREARTYFQVFKLGFDMLPALRKWPQLLIKGVKNLASLFLAYPVWMLFLDN